MLNGKAPNAGTGRVGENGRVMTFPELLMPPLVVLAHLGPLHAHERALVLLLAFGPFVVLGVVVAIRRRRDIAQEERERDHSGG